MIAGVNSVPRVYTISRPEKIVEGMKLEVRHPGKQPKESHSYGTIVSIYLLRIGQKGVKGVQRLMHV